MITRLTTKGYKSPARIRKITKIIGNRRCDYSPADRTSPSQVTDAAPEGLYKLLTAQVKHKRTTRNAEAGLIPNNKELSVDKLMTTFQPASNPKDFIRNYEGTHLNSDALLNKTIDIADNGIFIPPVKNDQYHQKRNSTTAAVQSNHFKNLKSMAALEPNPYITKSKHGYFGKRDSSVD